MDFFENSVSYDTLTQRLNEVYSEKSLYYNKVVLYLCLFYVVCNGVFAYLLYINDLLHIIYIPFIVLVALVLLTLAISKGVLNSNIRKEHLNKEIINLYNFTEGANVKYEVKPEYNKKYNAEMALFVRYASPTCKYKISDDDPEKLNYEILRGTLVTSNGKSSTVHFDGHYLIINKQTNRDFHIKHRKSRTNRKELKFYNIHDEEHHIYLSEKDYDRKEKRVIRPLDSQFLSLYSYTKEVFDTDKISIGSNQNEIHVAISDKIKFKFPKEFNYDNVKNYYDDFTDIIRGANQLIEYINEQEYM